VLKDDNQNEWKELDTQETMVRANKIMADTLNAKYDLKLSMLQGILSYADCSNC